jgi:hypothetical protein
MFLWFFSLISSLNIEFACPGFMIRVGEPTFASQPHIGLLLMPGEWE